jgi:hypothetical protein
VSSQLVGEDEARHDTASRALLVEQQFGKLAGVSINEPRENTCDRSSRRWVAMRLERGRHAIKQRLEQVRRQRALAGTFKTGLT